ncbi:bifunctional hydroxymethylpyrimidine kinase/phosphomethylpyrimidine kinase [Verrucomicrobium sp. GAS474]|uniref:bifunctional hydroxymethylpyrimidine kinase/phosphomethylpyrimidine kinase n=1 Tax=Verrucomicrobium sp. GAS474 TaxID=1882831 RepID=UPI001E646FE4|nr:bifunctional hydroxymethylpyrimidine kinase/phosphomethylpyrimidine kinase [Verrucomicrobium sp. GAS474]
MPAPVALTIAGSDNSGGAGLQADLKTFAAFGLFGTTAVTCVVAEHPGRVSRIDALPPASVAEQIALTAEAYPVAAVKTGMLYSTEIIETVAATLAAKLARVPLVIDPVMVASSGAVLLKPEAIKTLRTRLLPHAALVTPNRDEAELLLGGGKKITDPESLREAARELALRFGVPFLVKGGHLRGEEAIDILHDGTEERHYLAPMLAGVNPHGTGCTFSAAVAAGLARGVALPEAVAAGKRFISRAIGGRFLYGQDGAGKPYQLLNHFVSSAE